MNISSIGRGEHVGYLRSHVPEVQGSSCSGLTHRTSPSIERRGGGGEREAEVRPVLCSKPRLTGSAGLAGSAEYECTAENFAQHNWHRSPLASTCSGHQRHFVCSAAGMMAAGITRILLHLLPPLRGEISRLWIYDPIRSSSGLYTLM